MDRWPPSCARRLIVPTLIALAALTLVVRVTAIAGEDPLAEPMVAEQPAAVARALREVYHARDLERFGALLTDDYRFHGYDETGRNWHLEGFDRDFELKSARCMFGSDSPDTNCPQDPSPAESIECRMKRLSLAEDPEHPDSTEQYAIVVAQEFQVVVHLPVKVCFETDPGQHVFHVVRGDAARLSHGQPADAQHWYLRRWIAYTDAPGPGGPGVPTPASFAPGTLALRPAANPSDRDLAMWYALAGSERAELTVFDVQGRRITARRLAGGASGEQRIALGAGAKLQPGIYWVHLTQPGQRAVSRMVTVR